jgi:hypothetical protein
MNPANYQYPFFQLYLASCIGGQLARLLLLLTGSCDWRVQTASALLPSLVGQLLYGAITAGVFLLLER